MGYRGSILGWLVSGIWQACTYECSHAFAIHSSGLAVWHRRVGAALALQRLIAGQQEAGRKDQPYRVIICVCRGRGRVGTKKDMDS